MNGPAYLFAEPVPDLSRGVFLAALPLALAAGVLRFLALALLPAGAAALGYALGSALAGALVYLGGLPLAVLGTCAVIAAGVAYAGALACAAAVLALVAYHDRKSPYRPPAPESLDFAMSP